jgi:UDP-N-acetylmuramoyl-L-alanyl-D-glutamate--2,6-diaminopimelate ligase
MRLVQLIAALPAVISTSGNLDAKISTITSDSRQVTPGALFVAYRGVGADGHRYLADALARGAVAVVVEQTQAATQVPTVVVEDGRAALAWLHAAWFGYPSRSMTVVGVTGTDGKTTTSNLVYSILEAGGIRAGMITTVNAVIGDQAYDTGLHTTTPDAVDVQRYLAQMRDAGTEIAVLETTSHGLAQHRVTAVEFDVAVVTNITHEHLDFHGSYEAYRDAKALLFRSLSSGQARVAKKQTKTAVLNADDASYSFLAQIPAERYIIYSARPGEAAAPASAAVMQLRAKDVRQAPG